MKKALKKIELVIWHYENGKRIEGKHFLLRGKVSGLSGDVDKCEIEAQERKLGIEINRLVME